MDIDFDGKVLQLNKFFLNKLNLFINIIYNGC